MLGGLDNTTQLVSVLALERTLVAVHLVVVAKRTRENGLTAVGTME